MSSWNDHKIPEDKIFQLKSEIDGEDIEVTLIGGIYHPSTPDVRYLRNGDPGYPGDAAELYYASAHLVNDSEIELSEKQIDDIMGIIENQMCDDNREPPEEFDTKKDGG